MGGVGEGDQVEKVAGGVGTEVDVGGGELIPSDPLANQEQQSQAEGGQQPGSGAPGGGAAEAEPLVHNVGLMEHGTARDLRGGGAQDEDGRVEPEDGRDGGRQPFIDVAIVGVEVAGGLGHEENADEGDEEHEVAAQGEEEADAGLGEALPGAAATLGALAPVVAFAVAAGAFVCGGTAAVTVAVIAFAGAVAIAAIDLGRGENRGHGWAFSREER